MGTFIEAGKLSLRATRNMRRDTHCPLVGKRTWRPRRVLLSSGVETKPLGVIYQMHDVAGGARFHCGAAKSDWSSDKRSFIPKTDPDQATEIGLAEIQFAQEQRRLPR